MKALRRKLIAVLVAVCVAIAGFGGGSAAARDRLGKSCGTLTAIDTTLNVDIAEGRLRTTCPQARHVMATYLARLGGAEGGQKVRLGSKVWGCYKSRPDGVGWDFLCGRLRPRLKGPDIKNYVYVGAGRRF
jgi:hypothetical protein